VTLPSQYNPATGTFDGQLPGFETNMGDRTSNFDANAGILWKKKIKILEPEIGLSFLTSTTEGILL